MTSPIVKTWWQIEVRRPGAHSDLILSKRYCRTDALVDLLGYEGLVGVPGFNYPLGTTFHIIRFDTTRREDKP